jgi:hypothetical protein
METSHPSIPWDDDTGPPPETQMALLIWHLALALREAHQRNGDELCVCGKPYPCQDKWLSEYGFLAAGGMLTWPPFLGPPPPVHSGQSL